MCFGIGRSENQQKIRAFGPCSLPLSAVDGFCGESHQQFDHSTREDLYKSSRHIDAGLQSIVCEKGASDTCHAGRGALELGKGAHHGEGWLEGGPISMKDFERLKPFLFEWRVALPHC